MTAFNTGRTIGSVICFDVRGIISFALISASPLVSAMPVIRLLYSRTFVSPVSGESFYTLLKPRQDSTVLGSSSLLTGSGGKGTNRRFRRSAATDRCRATATAGTAHSQIIIRISTPPTVQYVQSRSVVCGAASIVHTGRGTY